MAARLEILSLFNFTRDPFHSADLESADAARIKGLLGMAVHAQAQVTVVGERGIGKSRAVAAALKDLKIKPVRVLTPDKARITAGDIQQALIVDLSDEGAKKDKEVRVRQLRRILGEASDRGPVVVVIEESHRLHGGTLRSIKNLRELDWKGKTHLFAVILIGQSDCTQRAGLSEVRLRTETVHMHGLTKSEVAAYIAQTVGRAFSAEASARIAALPGSQNYLDLQEILIGCMANALAEGRDQVETADVDGNSQFLVPHRNPRQSKRIRDLLGGAVGSGPQTEQGVAVGGRKIGMIEANQAIKKTTAACELITVDFRDQPEMIRAVCALVYWAGHEHGMKERRTRQRALYRYDGSGKERPV